MRSRRPERRSLVLAAAVLTVVLASRVLTGAAQVAAPPPGALPLRAPALARAPVPTTPPAPAHHATLTPPPLLHGLLGGSLSAEAGQGPYGVERPFWACYDVANGAAAPLRYRALGVFVQETGSLHASQVDGEISSAAPLVWCEYLHIAEAGTYHLWLRVCAADGTCADLAGPVVVQVEE